MKKLDKKGFTLIELLAVIIIMGVLLLVAIPAVTRTINDSRKKAFISTVSSVIDQIRIEANSDNLGATLPCYVKFTSVSLEKGNLGTEYGNSYVVVSRKTDGTGFDYKVIATDKNFSVGIVAATPTLVDSSLISHKMALTNGATAGFNNNSITIAAPTGTACTIS